MANPQDLLPLAQQHYQAGQRQQCEALCWEVLQARPLDPEALYLLGLLAIDAGQWVRAIHFFQLGVSVQPAHAPYHHALGEAYRAWGGLEPALASLRQALELDATNAATHHALGLALLDQGESAAAEASFRQALALKPDHTRAHLNLGRVLQTREDLEGAAACYRAAIRLRPDYALAHNNLGVVLQVQGQNHAACERFREALGLQPDYPEAHFNLGNAQLALGDGPAAGASFRQALRLRPDYAKAHFGLGKVLEGQGDPATALGHFREAVRLNPEYAEAHQALGDLAYLQSDWTTALAAFQRALVLRPDNGYPRARLIHMRQILCDWRTWEADLERLWSDAVSRIEAGKPTDVIPFCAITTPWPAERLLAVARSHSDSIARDMGPVRQELERELAAPARCPGAGERLRVAYMCAEFRDHATSHLMRSLFGLHDRQGFEVFGYSFGKDDGSSYREGIRRDCDHFIDLEGLSAADCARRIHADGIHILVDLAGYANVHHMPLLALRPAPVQVHYLGFPGSTGADFIDWFISDPVVTPPELHGAFREQLVLLPHCYQVNDHRQPIADTLVTRAGCGLPAEGFIYCSFNNSYKIEPGIFGVWMRILRQVPGSVLWLYDKGPTPADNLRREAAAHGVDPGRLIFAGHLPKPEHMARHRVADLFLDTYHYNAHTTASDALWGGLPLLTCPGRTFAARVAASLLTAIGLPELIVPDLKEYERKAVHVAQHADELRELRERLAANRTTWPLFDTPRFVRNLEKAYRAIWARQGRRAEPIVVEDPEVRLTLSAPATQMHFSSIPPAPDGRAAAPAHPGSLTDPLGRPR